MKLSRDQKTLLSFGALALVGVLGYWGLQRWEITVDAEKMHWMAEPNPKSHPQITSLQNYIATHFADPDAEIVVVSAPAVIFRDKAWRVVRIRGKNAFGGPVIDERLAMYEGNQLMELVKPEAVGEALNAHGEELIAFSRAIKQAEEIDMRLK